MEQDDASEQNQEFRARRETAKAFGRFRLSMESEAVLTRFSREPVFTSPENALGSGPPAIGRMAQHLVRLQFCHVEQIGQRIESVAARQHRQIGEMAGQKLRRLAGIAVTPPLPASIFWLETLPRMGMSCHSCLRDQDLAL